MTVVNSHNSGFELDVSTSVKVKPTIIALQIKFSSIMQVCYVLHLLFFVVFFVLFFSMLLHAC